MDAEIVSIGHELLMGEVVDTNAPYLASQLPSAGLLVRWVSQVGDDPDHLLEALSRAFHRSDVTLTTGGLGPTEDDLTREAIARVVGEEIFVDQEQLEALRTWFLGRGFKEMPSRNIKQAYRIPSATWLPNPLGTAPGWWVERNGRIIAALPGPPHELKRMWEHEVRPRLVERSTGTIILTRTIKTFGLTEGDVDERVSPVLGKENPYVGVYAKPDGIHVRIIASGGSQEAAQALLRSTEGRIREILGSHIWGVDEETTEEQVGALLKEKGLTLAVMESCTGGLLAHTITEVPGSSHYFRGGVVAYATEVKVAHGVDPRIIQQHGVISEETAVVMAQAIRERFEADFGIGITGVAGPDPQEGKDPGIVFIGIAYDGGTRIIRGRYPPRRQLVKSRATVGALLGLWQELQKLP